MGKEGLHLVLLAFNNEGIKEGDARKAVKYYLENYPDDDKVTVFHDSIILNN